MFRGGRGRGRGPTGPKPVARDDDGNIVQLEEDASGPPPLYPDIVLPQIPEEEDQRIDEMVNIFSDLQGHYKASIYNIKSEGSHNIQQAFEALKSELNLSSVYFPKELWVDTSEKLEAKAQKQMSGKGNVTTRTETRRGNKVLDISLSRIEELARREVQNDDFDTGIGSDALNEEKGEADEREIDNYDEDDAFGGDDDPFQQYDDDDEYDDPDDDDGGDAYF